MSDRRAIEAALREAALPTEIAGTEALSGGCIHRVCELRLADGTRVVAKSNDAARRGLFEEEAAGLRALAETRTVLVPRPLAVAAAGGCAVLLMTALRPHPVPAAAWSRFGRELAALHRSGGGARYGFETDNHLGSTPQPNGFCDDWVEFNARHRLGHQLALARRGARLSAGEAERIERVIERLAELIPRRPRPALLHGDLWSGNAVAALDERDEARIAVIDPACSRGDGWADIAMMKLFGGFPASCFEAYGAEIDDHDGLETRLAVYQLYHVLNHVNLFGRGYVAQAMSLARRLA